MGYRAKPFQLSDSGRKWGNGLKKKGPQSHTKDTNLKINLLEFLSWHSGNESD